MKQLVIAIVATIGGVSLLGAIVRLSALGVRDTGAVKLASVALVAFAALWFFA